MIVPDLPPFGEPVTLRDAIKRGWVTHVRGKRLSADQLQRWASRGCRVIKGGELFLFPTVRAGGSHVTCEAWCAAWRELVTRLFNEAHHRRAVVLARCRAV